MLTVTTIAKDKLRQHLIKSRDDDAALIRIEPSFSDPANIGFTLDMKKDGDTVVTDNEGSRLLIMDCDVAERLDSMVLDFDEKDGLGYIITSE